ncbi:excalibur calcium-binding domain-containing protein [Kribbella sp. NPDC051936]|uniref:excalibur calcium-binding domain-containing protein n=1 Tax=Kribbella sp. NPDC051936 TaxID=3154946 RepID=UPI00341FB6CB
MRQFNAPPGWPDPPTARWRPPKRWQPPESWPPAPAGWAFWVDESGKRVRGPIGRYGGPGRIKVGAIAAVPLALITLVLLNPFGNGDESASTAPVRTSEPTSAPTSTPVTEPSTTGPTATTEPSTLRSTEPSSVPTPTTTPSAEPSESRTPSVTPKPAEPSPTNSRTEPTPTTVPVTTGAAVYKSCAEARAAGAAPLHRGDPGYSAALDRNGDGVACDRGNS